MALSTHTTSNGYLLPSIHSAPPFFTQQPNPATQAIVTEQWTRLILSYARYKRLFTLRVEDAETTGGDWDEVLRNTRINRKLRSSHLSSIIASMVAKDLASYEPPRQTRSVLLYWRLPEEWAEVLHDWANSTGQLNTILTFYDITDPPVESPLTNIPIVLLKKAISILAKTGRAQLIAIADGEGVRFFAGNSDVVIQRLGDMDENSKLVSVKRTGDKLQREAMLADGDGAELLLKAVNDFQDRIVPAFTTIEKQAQEIANLRTEIQDQELQNNRLCKKLKDAETLIEEAHSLRQSLNQATEQTEKAITFAEMATNEMVELRDEKEQLERKCAELSEQHKLRCQQLEKHRVVVCNTAYTNIILLTQGAWNS
ncbi:hypothetical protein AX16_008120 [Volvariella volvacea WC 439]|nr:hypothetical protein AX16_008120 [Volvariella volvacea WC 439]